MITSIMNYIFTDQSFKSFIHPFIIRVYFSSNGIGNDYKERLLGCFRLHGTKVGNTLVEYMNMNRFYLTPDAMSTMFISHWLISEQVRGVNRIFRNKSFQNHVNHKNPISICGSGEPYQWRNQKRKIRLCSLSI